MTVGLALLAFTNLVAIVALPNEIQRSLSMIKEQDALFKTNSDAVLEGINTLLDSSTSLSSEEASKLLDNIKEGLLQGLSHAEEKVSVAEHIHETARGHIVKLEDDLKHFEEEVRLAKIAEANKTIVHQPQAEPEEPKKSKDKRNKSKDEALASTEQNGRKRSRATVEPEAPMEAPKSGEPGNEPTYCYCGQPSYGEMIGCDANSDCEIEWFHYGCVGLETPPKDQWFCPDCSARMARDPLSVGHKDGTKTAHKKPRPNFVQ